MIEIKIGQDHSTGNGRGGEITCAAPCGPLKPSVVMARGGSRALVLPFTLHLNVGHKSNVTVIFGRVTEGKR